ncbi:lipopolysaccharide-induced tumor necrosis factor-alpha factor homolog isoform X2 [Musca autumnalis]|uniref:lipopolysaccharide-induced tumor necrosis factor-alpha factor homolog isoform X2 n=1 Tax=Musca autumnalis TaxID=221902 RepID=UPI003CEFFA2E
MSYSQPIIDAEYQPGYTPASYYLPGQEQPTLYPPMPQPPYQQPPPPVQQPHTVIIENRTQLVGLGNQATRMQCPECHAEIMTAVDHTANSKTHCWALVLFCFLCWPCVCVPYCMDSCQTANHSCPNCNAYIGSFDN